MEKYILPTRLEKLSMKAKSLLVIILNVLGDILLPQGEVTLLINDDADKSINSNLTSITMRKDFYPSLNSTFYYELCFQNAFDEDCDDPILSSTGFRVTEYPNFDVYVEDRNKKIVLYRLDSVTGEKVVLDSDIGDIDYEKGELKMYNLTIIKGSFFDNRISLRVKPLSNDIKAMREVYLDVDVPNSSFTAYKE